MALRFGWMMTGLMVCGSAWAHSELPEPRWCQHGEPVVVGHFELLPQALIQARAIEQQTTCPPNSPKTCGQFDDDYGTGRRLAMATCAVYSTAVGGGDLGSVIYMVEQPESFNDELNHHALYTVEQGLQGSCVRCQIRELRPVDPRDGASSQ